MHPIVRQMSLSENQKPAVTARGHDVLVLAGAGTGKTRTLVARYLALIAEGFPLRSVLAITFTRKAAWEMRNRVRTEVNRYLDNAVLGVDERQRWQDIYVQLDAARIGTIHNLCTEILGTHPVEADVDPRFDVLDEGQTNILIAQAIDEALALAADSDEAASLFVLLGERGLRDALHGLMHRRLDAEDAFQTPPTDLLARWQRVLRARQEATLDQLRTSPRWKEALAALHDNTTSAQDDRMEIQRRTALSIVEDSAGLSLPDQLASLSRLNNINLTGGRRAVWPGGREQLDAVKSALRVLRDLWHEQAGLLELAVSPLDEVLAESIAPLREVFSFANARYAGYKRERNVLDFDDLESNARNLLQSDTSVRTYWQAETQAILVDEFQDTNGRQRDLVRLLNGGRGTLFAVGDAKQSIYRFRGADVTIFRTEQERIQNGGGTVLTLDTSYRGHRALIESSNALLGPVLGQEDPARPWVQAFSPLRHQREDHDPGFSPPHVQLFLTVGSKRSGALDRSADVLTELIFELVDSGAVHITEGSGSRPLDYGDIAILCRASTSFAAYENAFEGRVPFQTVAGRGFYGRPEIRDLLNALQALADPTDDLALTGLLRSPAFALSDEALYRLLPARQGRHLWDVLRTLSPDDLGEESERAQRAIETIDSLKRQAGRIAVADLLKKFLDKTDYRAALVKSGQTRAVRNVAKLLADASISGIVSADQFLEYISNLRDTGAREGEARDTGEGAVQIMSIHAAKGLEFPVVVIGDITSERRGRNSELIDPEMGILLPIKDTDNNLSMACRLGRLRERDLETAESNRLFYVGATRAREMLILSGCVDLKRDGGLRGPKGWFAQISGTLGLDGMTVKDYDDEGGNTIRLDLELGHASAMCTVYEPGYTWAHPRSPDATEQESRAASAPRLLMPIPSALGIADQRTKDQDRIPPQRVWQVVPTVSRPRAPAWVIGSIVHKALAAWRFPGDGFDLWAEARAREEGITDRRQLSHAAGMSRQLLVRFQAHSLHQEMDRADRRLHEVPYSLPTDGSCEHGIIDALYLGGGGWTLVEFKTDSVRSQAEFRRILDTTDYVAQTGRYVNAVEQLLGQRPRAQLCMLDYDGAVRVVDYADIAPHP